MTHPILAAVLSFLIPGLGQLYGGRFLRAVGFFVIAIVASVVFLPAGLVVAIVAAYDAYKLTS